MQRLYGALAVGRRQNRSVKNFDIFPSSSRLGSRSETEY